MPRVRFVVVGAGRAGIVHARNLRFCIADASLEGLVDPDTERAKILARELELPQDRVFPSLEKALDALDAEAVVIATPTPTHAPLALMALERGLHVFCEKPLARNLAEGRAMVEAARRSGRVLQVGFMRRFDPAFSEARRLIQQGAIGRPIYLRSLTRCPGLPPRWAWDPREGLGLLGEVNSHDFDVLYFLSGLKVVRVSAWGRALRFPEYRMEEAHFYDTVTVLVELERGVLGNVEGICPAGYGYDTRAEVVGEEGTLMLGGLERYPLVRVRTGQGGGLGEWPVHPSWTERFHEAYRAEMHHFVQCVAGRLEPEVTGEDGLHALEAALAAERSLREGRPVALEEVRA
jgi:predicted dehydrogenase